MASQLAAIGETKVHKSEPPQQKPKEKKPIIVEHQDDSLEDDEFVPLKADDDGWTTVEKKIRVKRDRVQEALDNGDAPLSDEDEDQSYWDDQPEEYETYWDRKP
jgi:hypothetical protein